MAEESPSTSPLPEEAVLFQKPTGEIPETEAEPSVRGGKKLLRSKTTLFAFLVLLVGGILVYRLARLPISQWFQRSSETETAPTPTLAPGVPGSKEGISPGEAVAPGTPAGETAPPGKQCDKGFLFSQKECQCVPDTHACAGLSKQNCEKKEGCYSFSRSGTCVCPQCESFLEHQCLPRD